MASLRLGTCDLLLRGDLQTTYLLTTYNSSYDFQITIRSLQRASGSYDLTYELLLNFDLTYDLRTTFDVTYDLAIYLQFLFKHTT